MTLFPADGKGGPKVLAALALTLIPASVFLVYQKALGFFFFLDDWHLVGPAAGARFLSDPLGIFKSFQFSGHFAPLAGLYYSLASLCFGANPFPYHLMNLLLLSLASLLLFRLLRLYGISRFPAWFSSLFFALTASHLQVPLWITAANYLLLASLAILVLHHWELFLRQGADSDLGLTALFLLGAIFCHSLGMVLVPVLFVRCLVLDRKDGRTEGRKDGRTEGRKDGRHPSLHKEWGVLLGLAGISLVAQILPRWLFSGSAVELRPNLSLAGALEAIWRSFSLSIVPGVIGKPAIFGYSLAVTGWGIVVLLWFWRRNGWRLAVTGIALALMAWILPFVVLDYTPLDFSNKWRYMMMPNLGVAMLLAVLLENFGSILAKLKGASLRVVPPLLAVLLVGFFLYQTLLRSNFWIETLRNQDEYVRGVVSRYRVSLPEVLGNSTCSTIQVVNTPLLAGRPSGLTGDLHIQNLDHATIHRFFFQEDKSFQGRVEFLTYNLGMAIPSDPCAFVAWRGLLVPGASAGNIFPR